MEETALSKLLIETGRNTRKAFESYYEQVCEDPLKPVAGRVFGYLARHPHSSSQDIQAEFSLSKATVSECLSLLIERGYIEYTKSKEDAREKYIELTEAGRARSKRYQKIVNEFERKFNQSFNEEELDALCRLLNKVKQITEDMDYGK